VTVRFRPGRRRATSEFEPAPIEDTKTLEQFTVQLLAAGDVRIAALVNTTSEQRHPV